MERERVIQFLLGLSSVYEKARDRALRTNPLLHSLSFEERRAKKNWWALKTIVLDNQSPEKKFMTLFPNLGLDLYHQRYLDVFRMLLFNPIYKVNLILEL